MRMGRAKGYFRMLLEYLVDFASIDGISSSGESQRTRFSQRRVRGQPSRDLLDQVTCLIEIFAALGAKFGVGRCGGIEKTSLISLTSEERRTRPHMRRA